MRLPPTLTGSLIDNVEIDSDERPLFNIYAGSMLGMTADGALRPIVISKAPAPRVFAMCRSSLGMLVGSNSGLGCLRAGRFDWIGDKGSTGFRQYSWVVRERSRRDLAVRAFWRSTRKCL